METSGEWMSSEIVLMLGRRVTECLLIHRYDGQLQWGKHNRSTLITETDDLVEEENTRSDTGGKEIQVSRQGRYSALIYAE